MTDETDEIFPAELTDEFRADIARILASALGQPSLVKLQAMLQMALGSLIASGVDPAAVMSFCSVTCANYYIGQARGDPSIIDGVPLDVEDMAVRIAHLRLAGWKL